MRLWRLTFILALYVSACTPGSGQADPQSPFPSPTITSGGPAAFYTPIPEAQIDAPAWFESAILYEIFVRSYYDSDGDGIGDLAGITTKLDYLESLGINTIWLMPIHPSPSYHGYDVTDYYGINPDYGEIEDMITLVDAAHERGIRVVMDFVINHMSNEHPFFIDAYGNPASKYADWFIWRDDAHTSYQAYGGYKHMPELNHANPDVYQYVLDVAQFWMDLDGDDNFNDGIDGFRCDVAKDVPLPTWQNLRQELRALNPQFLLLGEVWESNLLNMVRWYDQAFDALFDYPLYHAIANQHDVNLDSVLSGTDDPQLFPGVILGEEKRFPAGYQIVRFLNNHDNNRVMSEVGLDWDRARTAATFLLTLPGTTMIYYGEEIGMLGEKGVGPIYDEFRREPLDWYTAETGPGMATWFRPPIRFNSPDDGISVQEQDDLSASLLSYYRALIALRKAHPALNLGAFGKVDVNHTKGVYAFTRHWPPGDGQPEEWFLVIVNFNAEQQSLDLGLTLAYSGPFIVTDALLGEQWPDIQADQPYPITLSGASAVVLELRLP